MKIKKILLILFAISLCFVTVSCINKTADTKEDKLQTKQTTNSPTEDEFSIIKTKLDEEYNKLFPNKDLSNFELTEEIKKITDKWNDLSEKYIKLFKDKYNDRLSKFKVMHDNADTEGYLKSYKDFISKIDEKNKSELELFKSINDVVTDCASSSVAVAKYDYTLSREKASKIYEFYNFLKNR